jgi:acid phosphatase family membrane protein YuiD
MPSSHSAGVSSLSTFIALRRGIPTIDFALSLVYGLIVMYDAQGIRRQTGELTLKVNNMGDLIDKVHSEESIQFEEKPPKKLKEMLGHEPEEVLGGALLGIITGTIGHIIFRKR